jgi:ATP-dependent helicase HrpA
VLETLASEIHFCQIVDRQRLSAKLHRLQNSKEQGSTSAFVALAAEVEESKAKCARRAAAIPQSITFPENLPVSERASDIVGLLQENQVLIIAGDTGSGKTTQLPKMCLAAGYGRYGLIGHTQPRRLAAVSVADRIAEELGVSTGTGVGYQVRFNEKTSAATFLKLMTDGILLAEIQQDRFLNQYEVIIIDEAHERSLNIDFLLGFLKLLLPKRPDLKVIITSATIDLEKFSAHFDNAPIVSVSGRTFPVTTQYKPINESTKGVERSDDALLDAVVDEVRHLFSSHASGSQSSDVLVFLATEREIREAATAFRKARLPNTEILPLYSRLRHSEQVKIFQPHVGRRVVLSTNVAETSITVPGIRYVVDTGFARMSRYNLQSKVQRLPIEAISKASANQRQGRCGRVAEGVCVRLYSETDFNSRPEYTDPEIKRTNLASVILRMRSLKLGEVEQFPYLEAPELKAINEGFKLLFELNALTPKRELTNSGVSMARLPIDPKYGRMLVVAKSLGCLKELLIIVSALSISDPREVPLEGRQIALERLSQYNHQDSDFLTLVKLWDDYEEIRQRSNQNQLRKYCKQNFLSYSRMREWREIHRQLLLSCQQMGWRLNQQPGDYRVVHESIISGSLNQIATKSENNQYLGNRNRRFKLLSSSVLSDRKLDWIVTGDLLETHQVFASMAAKIDPEWVEHQALHLVKREYFGPHWSKKRQQVMAYEKVHLFGLTLTEKSLIPFVDIDPIATREIFINEGLINQQLHTKLSFYRENNEFLAELSREEEKIRRPDIIISDTDLARFYDQALPDDIASTRDLEAWHATLSRSAKDDQEAQQRLISLQLKLSDLIKNSELHSQFKQFPDKTEINRNQLTLGYLFDPLSERDGATIEIPAPLLPQLTQADIDWAVPGIIREKCITLLKGLPKATRKQFIPVSGFVDQIIGVMTSADGTLFDALLLQIRKLKHLNLSRADFESVELPKHLVVKIAIKDETGKEIDFGYNLNELKRRSVNAAGAGSQNSASSEAVVNLHPIEQEGLTDWTFGDLPQSIELGTELVLVRFPALIDGQTSVSIKLLSDQDQAIRSTRLGLSRLLMLRSVQQKNSITKSLNRFIQSMSLQLAGSSLATVDDIVFAVYKEAFYLDTIRVCDNSSFLQLLNEGKSRLIPTAEKLQTLLRKIIEQKLVIGRSLNSPALIELDYVRSDILSQLEHLIGENFLHVTDITRLNEFPRYLNAIESRLGKAPHMGARDAENTVLYLNYWRRYEELSSNSELTDNQLLQSLRWMLEEFRVSLFAQNLGTKIPVSTKRIEQLLETI